MSADIPLQSAENRRYFVNPFLKNPSEGGATVTDEWLMQKIKNLSNRLISYRPSKEEYAEDGPYTGISGIGYSLLRVSDVFPASESQRLVELCNNLIKQSVHEISLNISKSHISRYLTGTLGLYTVQAIADHKSGIPINGIVAEIRKLVDVVLVPGYQKIGDDEILNGRAGFLASILELRRMTKQRILEDGEIAQILEAIVKSGRHYSAKHKSPANLMYQWHGDEYLGAAHGVSGIYQILFSFWNLLSNSAKNDVQQSIEWFLSIQDVAGNFPSSTDRIGHQEELVHWCHGATGAVHLLIAAFLVFREDKFLKAAQKCADLIWARGALKKGPGICHGVSGNGYAFLLLYRLTGQNEFLDRAKSFAAIMMDPNFEQLARTPDSPMSLFEGWAGALCFLTDLLKPAEAQFPMIPINL